MAIELTFHDKRPREQRRPLVDALGPQVGGSTLIADGTVSAPLPETGLYRVVAVTPCRIRFGRDLTNASGGERWPFDGHAEVRFLSEGDLVAVDALS